MTRNSAPAGIINPTRRLNAGRSFAMGLPEDLRADFKRIIDALEDETE